MASSAVGALIARFDGSTLATTFTTAATGGLWFGEIPEQFTDLPLAAFFHDGDDAPENTTEREFTRWTHGHFDLYGTDLDVLGGYARTLETLVNLPDSNSSTSAYTVSSANVRQSALGRTEFFSAGRTQTDQLVYGVRVHVGLWVRYTR
jgi:hypothetical protein